MFGFKLFAVAALACAVVATGHESKYTMSDFAYVS
jgi:hypothetical protein